jgi:ubiquitin carboxyl-terminal hydrolase 9/24
MNNELMGEGNSGMTEPDFPHAKLALLDEKISSPRWVVPVLPEQELEVLLQASIDLCRKGKMRVYCTFSCSGVAI